MPHCAKAVQLRHVGVGDGALGGLFFWLGFGIKSGMSKQTVWDSVSPGLRKWGLRCWLYVGIALCVGIVAALLAAISGLVVPFLVALVIAMLFHPVVDWLDRLGLNRMIGSIAVVILLLGVLVACMWVMTAGILSQTNEMVAQVKNGFAALGDALERLNVPPEIIQQIGGKILSGLPTVASGAASIFTSGLSGTFTFFIASFASVFIMFYLMYDWPAVIRWLAGSMGVPRQLGTQLIVDATGAMREYFYALTLSSIVVSVTIGGTMYLLSLPLAMTIGLVTMVTSYIPYLGAIFSGAFAVLVAMGSGGLQQALIVGGVVLLVQNIIQTIIQNTLASDRLKLHPIVTFSTVIGGGILFGLLGAMLANPVAAMVGVFRRRFREYEESLSESKPHTKGD